MLLCGLAAWFILRPRLVLLPLNSTKGSFKSFYVYLAALLLAIPVIIAQEYMLSATGKLAHVKSIKDIKWNDDSRYYNIEQYYIDRGHASINRYFNTTGRFNSTFNMALYVASPILEKSEDIGLDQPNAWLGIKYDRSTSNRKSDSEKREIFSHFFAQSEKDFFGTNFDSITYFERADNSIHLTRYLEAVKLNSHYKASKIILYPRFTPYAERHGKKLPWLIATIFIALGGWFGLILIPKFKKEETSGNNIQTN